MRVPVLKYGKHSTAVLNLLTTKTKVHTFLTLITNFGELHLHYAGMEPAALRMALASVFVKMRRLDPVWQAARLQVLQNQHAAGAIDAEELAAARRRLLTASDWQDPVIEATELKRLQQESLENGPKGQCPNCDSIIPLAVESCPKCKASFGIGSAWKVTPV